MSPRRPLLVVFLALVALQATLAFVWVRPGPLGIDEVIFQWMTRSAAAGSPLAILNGYEEMPSRELATIQPLRPGDRFTAQYPVLWPALGGLGHGLMGFRVLFLLNALAFCGVLVFTWRMGRRLLGSGPAALGACAILAAGTYAWEYSMAGWPHMGTLLLQVAAVDAMLVALGGLRYAGPREGGDQERPAAALVAGFLAALAVGFRRDAVFLLPVLALPFLYARPPRLRSLGMLALGAAPPLVLVAWLNALRWGIWSPLTYGREEAFVRIVGVLGVLGILGLVALARPEVRAPLFARPQVTFLAAAAGFLVVLLLPATRDRAHTMLEGIENLFFDLRGARTNVRQYYWAVIWLGGLKKSLLQSLPWLPLLAIPLWTAWKLPERRTTVALLLLPVLVYGGVPAIINRHGGMSLNLRYLIPVLPFVSLLAAWALRDVVRAAARSSAAMADPGDAAGEADDPGSGWIDPAGLAPSLPPLASAVAAGVALAAGGWLLLRPHEFVTRPSVAAVLNAPLVIAGVLAVAVVLWLRRWRAGPAPGAASPAHAAGREPPPPAPAASLAVVCLASVALTWAAALAFDYDARWSRNVRAENLARSVAVAEHVEENSFLFAETPDWHGTVPELREGVIVAFPWLDGYEDMNGLAHHHLGRGRRVYAALTPPTWNAAREAGALEGLAWSEVGRADSLVTVRELRRAEPSPPERGGGAGSSLR